MGNPTKRRFGVGLGLGIALLLACADPNPSVSPTTPAPRPPPLTTAEAPPLEPSAANVPGERVQPSAEPSLAPAELEPAFPGQDTVSVSALIDAMEAIAAEMELSRVVRADYDAFLAEVHLEHSHELFRDYVRIKLAFESTRDGGLWRLRWTITNRAPNSEAIWAQWGALEPSEGGDPGPVTADAECDELSALFAFVVRRLGVDRVGLFWPQWNHVVAVWTIEQAGKSVRVVVPTSQIFLEEGASLGTRGFNPAKQKTIYTYKRKDVSLGHELPAALAEFFVAQARTYGLRSQAELQERRDARAATVGGS